MPSCVCITHDPSEESRPFKIKLVYGISILLPPPNSPSNNIKLEKKKCIVSLHHSLCLSILFFFSSFYICSQKLGVNVNYWYEGLRRERHVLFNYPIGEIPSFTRNDLKQGRKKKWRESGVCRHTQCPFVLASFDDGQIVQEHINDVEIL